MARVKRDPYTVLGREIGHASGWDMTDDWEVVFYEFIADSKFDLPSGDLAINYEKGLFLQYDDEGKVIWQADVIDKLQSPKKEPNK